MRFWRPPLYQLELLAYARFLTSEKLSSFLMQVCFWHHLQYFFNSIRSRIILLVFFGRVVAALALGAGQGDQSYA